MFEIKHSIYIAALVAYNSPLTYHILVGTACRYFIAFIFNLFANSESLTGHLRIYDKNPPISQMKRENDWDNALILSVLAFWVVDTFTPLFKQESTDIYLSVLCCFCSHYFLVEPIYYLAHYIMHKTNFYSHRHHHKSIVTMTRSGTSHPLIENIYYMCNFSIPFVVPALLNTFSRYTIIPYMIVFDVLNSIGHCNFEVIPKFMFQAPWKYFIYNTQYHANHHKLYTKNMCLFCPIWDTIFGTALMSVYKEPATNKPLGAVFLGHHFGLNSSFLNIKQVQTCGSTGQTKRSTSFGFIPLNYILLLLHKILRYIVVDRFTFYDSKVEVWGLPLHLFDYTSRKNYVNDTIINAIHDASKKGISHVGLGALNKAIFVNNNGADLVEYTPKGVFLVHGNTLTAALAWQATINELKRSKHNRVVAIIGSRSNIGSAIVQRLKDENIHVLTYPFNIENDFDVLIACSPIQTPIKKHVTIIDVCIPSNIGKYDNKFIRPADIQIPEYSKCDLTYSLTGDQGVMPACLFATCIHVKEKLAFHEVGPLDISKFEFWIELYNKYI
jgi:hypothetical protein